MRGKHPRNLDLNSKIRDRLSELMMVSKSVFLNKFSYLLSAS